MTSNHPIYRHQITTLDQSILQLANYQNQVLMIVNTASECGFTPQYTGLEKLYQNYKDRGLMVIGFPCNQFGNQEPGDTIDIQNFCSLTYPVSFPIAEKVQVNGSQAHPLYKDLKTSSPGLFKTKDIKWNFTKFLIAPNASSISRFGPFKTPQKMETAVLQLLATIK